MLKRNWLCVEAPIERKKMSYEGYSEHICTKGHYYTRDAYEFNETCPCGAGPAWENMVDQTNDNGYSFADFGLQEKTPVVTQTCECCGHTKQIEQATYHVPNEQDMSAYREARERFYDELYSKDSF